MAELLYNKEGIPLMGYGNSWFLSTTGVPAALKDVKPSRSITHSDEKVQVDKYEVSPWGDENNFPQTADGIINKIGVLNSGLKFIRNFTLGQGVFPCRITGYDNFGNEQYEVISDKELTRFLSSRVVRRYMEKAVRDYLKFGSAFPELIPSSDSKKIVGINVINALHCRYTKASKAGEIERCVVSGKWPDLPSEKSDYKLIDVLDEYDPDSDIERRRIGRQLGGKTIIYPLRDSWSNKDYYSAPVWWAAKLAGWTDVASKVPVFLMKAYQNQITWKWHVQIPYRYFDRMFPKNEYKKEEDRKKDINDFMDKLELNLCGEENANKPIFTFFEMNESGRAEEEWKIDSLDNKYKEGDKLVTSAAANSEILFSLMLNPNVMGAGMPGGTYAGNQGGSNIREAFLVNIANAWLDRQNILDPIECMLRYNGVKDVELRFRNTILTTLDSGSGTTKNLS